MAALCRSAWQKSCELDYTVTFAGSEMMSLMFFGVMGEGSEEIFERLPLNISLSDGKVLDISDVLDVETRIYCRYWLCLALKIRLILPKKCRISGIIMERIWCSARR